MIMHSSVTALLFSAAAGYWVLTLATKEKEPLKKLGKLVGFIIIAVSLAGTACKVYSVVRCSKNYCPPQQGCPFLGKAMNGSYTSKPTAPPS